MSPTTRQNEVPDSLKRLLQRAGADISFARHIDYGTQYRVTRGTDATTLNIYRTGKVSTGGKASELKELIEDWRLGNGGARGKQAAAASQGTEPVFNSTPRVGIDEAGKGDYFGPMVVTGVRVMNQQAAEKLKDIGVRDSKDLGVAQARRMAQRVWEELGAENLRVVSLAPREFEARRRSAGNVNKLLGELDADVIGELGAEVEVIVVDEFARAARSLLEPYVPEGVRLEVRPRAEDDAAVAAASILARARQLEEMDLLSRRAGYELPRGATHVHAAGRRVYAEKGMEGLRDVAKVSFGTTGRIVG